MLTTRSQATRVAAESEAELQPVLAAALRMAADAAGASDARLTEIAEGDDPSSAVPLGIDSVALVLPGARPRELGLLDAAARLVRQAWTWQMVAAANGSSGGRLRRRNFLTWLGEKMQTAVEQSTDLSLLLVELEDRDPLAVMYGGTDSEERVPLLYSAVERAVRGIDSVYRCDDATLAVVLPRCDRTNANKVAGRIRSALDESTGASRKTSLLSAKLRCYAWPDELAALAAGAGPDEVSAGQPEALLRLWLAILAGTFHGSALAWAADRHGNLKPAASFAAAIPAEAPRAVVDAFLSATASVLPRAGAGERAALMLPVVGDHGCAGILMVESVHGGFGAGDVEVGKRIAAHFSGMLQDAPPVVGTSTTTPGPSRGERFRYSYDGVIGQSAAMLEVFDLLERVIETDYPVIVEGESGTGKELIARAVHFNGRRREKPLIAENCAALNENLLEAELFGYEKGSFTGAETSRKGLFELADGGTLFLDEVADMRSGMQKDLLRILQEGIVRPVGSKRFLHVDVRIICASNKNLLQLVEEGKFRSDLFYRLNVWSIKMPALRERRDDIPLLVEHLLAKISQQTAQPQKKLGRGVIEALVAYDWPGNIRELKNEIARMVALSPTDEINARDFSKRPSGEITRIPAERADEILALEEVEKLHILKALRYTNGNRARAAEMLGINKATIYRKLKSYGFDA